MTNLNTILIKDLPVKQTSITDNDYVLVSSDGTKKLKIKDITKDVEKKAADLEVKTTELRSDLEHIDTKVKDVEERVQAIEENGVGGGNANIDDTTISKISTWSSEKMDTSINETKLELNNNINEISTQLDTIKTEWLGGKKNRYLTQIEYNLLTDLEKNDETIVYYITDKAEDTGLTVEQSAQLHTAYEHSQSSHFSGSYNDLLDKPPIGENSILTSENGNKFIIKVSNEGVLSTEQIIEYGNVIIDKTEISINEGSSSTFTVKLDKAPTNNQTVNVSVNNGNCNVEPNLITFTNSNYNIEQTVNVLGVHDSSSFENKNSVISVSSTINNKTINITINNVDNNNQGNTTSFNANDFRLVCDGVEISPQNDCFIITQTQTEDKYYFIRLINKEKLAYFKPNNVYNAVYDVLENTMLNGWRDYTASHASPLNTIYNKPEFDGTYGVTGVQKVPMHGISDESLFNERLNNQAQAQDINANSCYLIRLVSGGSGTLKFKLDFEERL